MSEEDIVSVIPTPLGIEYARERMPDDLIGATILKIGMPTYADLEGGGLAIDYIPNGESKVKRITFGFNENGMWLEQKLRSRRGDNP